MYFSLGPTRTFFFGGVMNNMQIIGFLMVAAAVCILGLSISTKRKGEHVLFLIFSILFAVAGKIAIKHGNETYKSEQSKTHIQKTSINNPRS